MPQLPELDQWLSLSQAAKILGVHSTTLRRWADNGDIPHMLTPGGHRRFASDDILQFSDQHRQKSGTPPIEKIWAEEALSQARRELVVQQDQRWISAQNDVSREEHRELGRRLLGLTLQYISDDGGNGALLAEAKAVGQEYGRIAVSTDLPLSAALQATLFFRDMLVETSLQLPESAHVKPEANLRLMRRINKLLNTVQLAIAEAYEK